MFESLLKTHKLMAGLLLAALLASGQEFRATLQGTIFDPNKAAVPGAELTLLNNETGVERKGASDGEGHYLFQFITPGKYLLTSKAAGFQTSAHEGIQLNVGDNVRLDIDLTLGAASETISVSASAVAVSTDTSSLGSLVGRDVLETLPLKGHSSLFVYQYVPGITNVGNGDKYGEDVRPIDQANGMRYTANGSPLSTGDVSVDGVSNVVDVNRGNYVSTYVPAVDAVLETKMQSGTLPAEYGRSAGSIMNVVIKSGTNDPHGSLYESWRNSALDANYFFNNIGGIKLPAYNVNNFGVSIGAPVFLPKIYNGKNRTFFFVSYEGLRQIQAQTVRINVPTSKMRTGDFSEVKTQIYDPFSVHPVNGVQTRDPLPGNIVPSGLQDPVGKNVFGYWPLPNLTPPNANSPWVSDYAMAARYPSGYNDVTIKFDQTISSKQQAFVRVNYGPGHLWNPYDFPGIAGPGRVMNSRPNSGAAISDTYVFSPTVAADFRAGFQRGNNTTEPYSSGFDVASLGFAAPFVKSVTQGKAFPAFSFNDGIESLGNGGFATNPGQSFSTEDAVTISRGQHLFKAGVDIRQLRGSQFNNGSPDGSFSFRSNETGGPNAAAPTGGFSLASLMMGFGGSGSLTTATAISWQNVYYGGYFQDDFRVSSKLTLNLGLRWEHESPRTERFDRSVVGFNYNAPSPLQVPGLNLKGGLTYANVNGAPRGIYNPDWHNFSPRVGFAYSLNSKTVVRGGYSLMYVPIYPPSAGLITTGYSVSSTWVTSTDGGITVANRLSNPLPSGLLPLTGNSQGMATNVGQAVSFIDPSDKPPSFHNWQVNIQRSLPSAGVIQVAYVGSRAIHLQSQANNNDNQLPTNYLSMGSALTQTVPNPFYGILTTGTLSGQTVQRAQLLLPYPQFTSVARNLAGYGTSSYNALQINYTKGLAHGLAGAVAYTWSKNLTNVHSSGSPQNVYNISTERSYADFDCPTRLTVALAWNLPIGRGRAFLTGINRAADVLVGGWDLSTSDIFQAGIAQAFGVSGGTYFANAIRPNVVGDPSQGVTGSIDSRLNNYFNKSAFALPANYTLGNAASRIGSVRSPGNNYINVTLSKSFQIYERVKADLRLSAFNLPNHPVFSAPNVSVGSSAFGVVNGQANAPRQMEVSLKIRF